jgi:hypothetical protein
MDHILAFNQANSLKKTRAIAYWSVRLLRQNVEKTDLRLFLPQEQQKNKKLI